ncbi:MAG TPA: asparagine synthase-related protein [Aliidongia sp.]|uniref:asparagine synthetase B family protein n=1 Tax=Aliidongia sp. TaxID=1914230 RepID=UPI002DDCAE78|nr:asparagine synthase-related protein [Aliidongia sp.]HEV2677166.1 asparagine synthase-related protein [Aliidongia sp.]
MSAFIAIHHRTGRPVDRRLLAHLTAGLAWRGPDGTGTWCEGSIGLGCALLRTDPETERHSGPIGLDGLYLVGDVRLDDRDRLLASLNAAGAPVGRGTSDDELLLHAYRIRGDDCLDSLAGDFSFCLWDGGRRRLLAARDQFGIMPLYVAEIDDVLVLSNSLLCVKAHPAVDLGLSEDAIAAHLAIGMNARCDTTFYRGIRRLENGCKLMAAGGTVENCRYWALPARPGPAHTRRPADHVDAFRELFDRAVGDRLRCEQVATDLSGGMDASSIASSVATLWGPAKTQRALRAHTFYFDHLLPDDEGRLARTIAAQHDMPLDLFPIEPLLDMAIALNPRHVAPEPAQALLSSHDAVFARAADHARVLLRGYGGDPLFDFAGLPPVGAAEILRALPDMASLGLRHRRKPWNGVRQRRHAGRRRSWPLRSDSLLDRDFARREHIDDRRLAWLEQHLAPSGTGMATDILWRNLFDRADADFTGVPLQVRYPFFDLRLVRFVNGIPPLPWRGDKMLLRLSMAGRLPAAVLHRHKTALAGTPIKAWLLRDGPKPWMFDLLSLDAMQPYIDRAAVADLLRHPERLDQATVGQIYFIWTLAIWLRDLPSRREPADIAAFG